MPIDPAEEWQAHECETAGCLAHVDAEYEVFLAKMTAEQRAEWERCCALFAEKFGKEVDHA